MTNVSVVIRYIFFIFEVVKYAKIQNFLQGASRREPSEENLVRDIVICCSSASGLLVI